MTLLFLLPCAHANARSDTSDVSEILDAIADEADLSDAEEALGGDAERVFRETLELALDGGIGAREFVSTALLECLAAPIKNSFAFFASILSLTLVSIGARQLTSSFENDTKRIVGSVCMIAISLPVLSKLCVLAGNASDMIGELSMFLEGITPPLLAILSAIGAASTAAVTSPLSAFASMLSGKALSMYIMPFIIAAGALSAADTVSGASRLSSFISLISGAAKWALGTLLTVFAGVVAISGAVASSFDGISVRAMKYTLSSAIPIVGGALSDSAETVIGCALAVRNAIGVAGVLAMVMISIGTLAELALACLSLKLCRAIASAISGDGGVFPDSAENVFQALLSVTSAFSLVFFITLTVIFRVGNGVFL